MTVNVSGGFGTITLTAPTGTVTTVDVLFSSKVVAFAIEGGDPTIIRVTKSTGYVASGVQQNRAVVAKAVAYAVLLPKPVNNRRSTWLFVGRPQE